MDKESAHVARGNCTRHFMMYGSEPCTVKKVQERIPKWDVLEMPHVDVEIDTCVESQSWTKYGTMSKQLEGSRK